MATEHIEKRADYSSYYRMVGNRKEKEGRFMCVFDGQKQKLGSAVGLSAIVNNDISPFELLALASAC